MKGDVERTRAGMVVVGILSLLCVDRMSLGMAITTSLDGTWMFAVDSAAEFSIENISERASWRVARVPLSWQAQHPDLRDYQGIGWYRREFYLRPLDKRETALLRFEAVDYYAEVFVNRHPVGAHEGGYTPFECDIGSAVLPGRNEVLVRVIDPVLSAEGTEGFQYSHIPHGKQTWYVQTSGLWQSVTLRVVPTERITRVHVTPSASGEVLCELLLTESPGRLSMRAVAVEILGPSGSIEDRAMVCVSGSTDTLQVQLRVSEPRFWSCASPTLYTVRAAMDSGGEIIDRFGFRQIEARDGRLFFNGEPFYMVGALDQDFYPVTVYTVPSTDTLRNAFLAAKQLGLNTLRCHIKVPDRRYLDLADEVGLLIWYEVPNWGVFSPDAGRRAFRTLDEMLERDWNHPSLVIIGLINESWGLDLQEERQRSWLAGEYFRVKERATGRLVVDNSVCWGNFHLATDINDYHTYWAVPENRGSFDHTVKEVAARPRWLFSPFGDALETGQEPLIMSEFGNWGLPHMPAPLPWWTERPFFEHHVVHPLGFEERFRKHQLLSVFGSYDALVRSSQQGQAEALKYEIESLRAWEEFSGYVITEFTDVNWECNGLLDMWRRGKVCADVIPDVQQERVVIPRPRRYNWWASEVADIEVRFSNFGSDVRGGGVVIWSSSEGACGSVALPHSPSASVGLVDTMKIPLPAVNAILPVTVRFSVLNSSGDTLARNGCTVFVYPDVQSEKGVSVRIHDPAGRLTALTEVLRRHQQAKVPQKGGRQVVVTDILDDTIVARLDSGGRVLLLVGEQTILPKGFPCSVILRDTGMYDGNWASNMNWVRTAAAPFGDLPSAPRLGFEVAEMGLPLAIGGVEPEYFDDVLSGIFVGWIHNNAAFIVQMSVGPGILVVCAFPLSERCTVDPFAATMLYRLVEYCGGDSLRPRLTWNQ